MIVNIDDYRNAELVVESAPLDGVVGFMAWRIIGRNLDHVKQAVEALQTGYGVTSSSFTTPHRITKVRYHDWWHVEGYTVDEAIRKATQERQYGNKDL